MHFTLNFEHWTQIFLPYQYTFKYIAATHIYGYEIYFVCIFSPGRVLKSGHSQNRKRRVFCQRSHCREPVTSVFLVVWYKLIRNITCLKENVSLKKGFRVFLWTFVSNFRFLSGIRYTCHDIIYNLLQKNRYTCHDILCKILQVAKK